MGFRSALPDTTFAADLVDFINEDFLAKKVAFIYVNDDFGKGGFEGFKTRGQKYGLQIVAEERYARRSRLHQPVEPYQGIGRGLHGRLVALCRRGTHYQADEADGHQHAYFGSDGQAHPKFRELGASATEGAYYPTHFSVTAIGGNKVAQDFTAKIRAAYNKDPDFVHAQAFDAMTATIMAIQKAGMADRTKIRDALRICRVRQRSWPL